MFLRGKSHQRIEQQDVNPPGFTSGIILKPFRGSQNELNRERDSLFLQTMQFNLPKSTEKKKTLHLLIFFQIKIIISDILWLNQSLAG